MDLFFGGIHRFSIKSATDTFLEEEKIFKISFSWYFCEVYSFKTIFTCELHILIHGHVRLKTGQMEGATIMLFFEKFINKTEIAITFADHHLVKEEMRQMFKRREKSGRAEGLCRTGEVRFQEKGVLKRCFKSLKILAGVDVNILEER